MVLAGKHLKASETGIIGTASDPKENKALWKLVKAIR
jgi:hypothetical protein